MIMMYLQAIKLALLLIYRCTTLVIQRPFLFFPRLFLFGFLSPLFQLDVKMISTRKSFILPINLVCCHSKAPYGFKHLLELGLASSVMQFYDWACVVVILTILIFVFYLISD